MRRDPALAPISRRSCLLALGLLPLATRLRADDRPEPADVAAVTARAREAGIAPWRVKGTGQYVVAGDAPDAFRARAADICEGLATDFLDHFSRRKFAVTRPVEKLVVIALSGPAAFSAFMGLKQDEAVGGVYDLTTNRLVIFDNRARDAAGPNVARANTVALTHEATHQLAFNTGLLNREADVPLAISEGLATYGEVRRPDGKAVKFGDTNVERLKVLAAGAPWFPTARLLVEDALFDDAETDQAAYAQSWLLVHLLMSAPRVASFRDYLKTIAARKDGASRLADATAHLGEMARLDADLKRHGARLGRR